MAKVIRNNREYDSAMEELIELMESDPELGSPEFDQMELLTVLIRDYEAKTVEIDLPDPIEAIRFRMEQENLRQRDLVPFLGSRSRVSEVLSGKRSLSLTMARALHTGLGIPATVLLQAPDQLPDEDSEFDWNSFPIKEMVHRGWIPSGAATNPRRALKEFFAPIGSGFELAALFRTSAHVRSARTMDSYALLAWSSQIVREATDRPVASYRRGTVDLRFMQSVARLSPNESGPREAVRFLSEHGVALVIEPHLSGTYLDGAAILSHDHPIIALTVRHDRIDNFWFTLMHELAHVALHETGAVEEFFDDLDFDNPGDEREEEADALAGEALIPEGDWAQSPARRLRTPEAAEHLAKKLSIHPAIVAGRMRFETQSYQKLSHMVGHGEVRQLFPNIEWP